MNLQWNFSRLVYDTKEFADIVSNVKKIYDCLDVQNQVHDGVIPYPSPAAEKEGKGMAIEVRYAPVQYAQVFS